ncbi:MAG: hypothetical protein D8M57_09480 [Candidatus Scalindua sp. AMX11]|nr:MAG: hypothetical protein DWQ00_01150 [Candidatus Scalindua sp.]TDE65121.1 MAG: hypothetical protein D8M57_09480 [Candidatus Scalindua sp. AMX11]
MKNILASLPLFVFVVQIFKHSKTHYTGGEVVLINTEASPFLDPVQVFRTQEWIQENVGKGYFWCLSSDKQRW